MFVRPISCLKMALAVPSLASSGDFLIPDAPNHDDVINLSALMDEPARYTPDLMEALAFIKPYGSHILSADHELHQPDSVLSCIA
jgi:hypothetical protein